MVNHYPKTTRVFSTLILCFYLLFSSQILLASDNVDLITVSTIAEETASGDSNSLELSEGNECTSATVISTLPYNTSGNTSDFANDYSESDVPEEADGAITNGLGSPAYLSGPEAVYAYTPVSDQSVTIAITGTSHWTALWAFTGCPFSAMVGYHTSVYGSTRSIPELPLTAGVTYFFVVSSWQVQTASTSFSFSITENIYCPPGSDTEGLLIGSSCNDEDPDTENDVVGDDCVCAGTPLPVPPENDDCENAFNLICNAEPVTQSSAGSTAVNTAGCGVTNGGLWYTFIGNGDNIDISSTATFDHALAITRGACDAMVSITCKTAVGIGGTESHLILNTIPDEQYFIYVGRATNSNPVGGNNITIGITCETPAPAPPNDLCADAIALECGQTVEGSSTGSTIDTEGILFCFTFLNNAPGVWYKISGVNGTITATTCSVDGPEFNTRLGVFTGMCDEFVCVTGNDDSPFGATDLDCTIGDQTFNRGSTVIFDAVEGTTYYILVTGFFSFTVGDFDLTVTCEEDPPVYCPELEANVGDACDDQDATTENDLIGSDCVCAGTPIIVYDCPDLMANFGDACDDGDANTEYDLIGTNCLCAGTIIVYDCPVLMADFGDSCDDEDAETENDIVGDDCVCAGTPIPENDDCENAFNLICNAEPVTQSSAGSMAVNTTGCLVANGGLWYTFIGNGDNIDISSTATFDHALGITRGACDEMISINCKTAVGIGGTESHLILNTIPDEQYFVYVGRATNSNPVGGNNITIGITCETPAPAPPNDLCADAIALECGQTVEGSSTGSTVDIEGNLFCFTFLNIGPGVWYTIPGVNGTITASTCSVDGPEFNTRLGVFTGMCDELVCVTGNDDSPFGATDLDCTIGDQTFNRGSTVIFDTVEGTTYYILVTGFFSFTVGDFDLTVTCEENPPANLNGSVNWNISCGDRATTVHFYEHGTSTLVATYNTTLEADGTFTIVDVTEGTFDIFVKVTGHLQKGFGNVTISSGGNPLTEGNVVPGDINNVDGINIDDITILLGAFGTTIGDPHFNPLADLNCDEDVNVDDLTLLIPNFGQSGDNPPIN